MLPISCSWILTAQDILHQTSACHPPTLDSRPRPTCQAVWSIATNSRQRTKRIRVATTRTSWPATSSTSQRCPCSGPHRTTWLLQLSSKWWATQALTGTKTRSSISRVVLIVPFLLTSFLRPWRTRTLLWLTTIWIIISSQARLNQMKMIMM